MFRSLISWKQWPKFPSVQCCMTVGVCAVSVPLTTRQQHHQHSLRIRTRPVHSVGHTGSAPRRPLVVHKSCIRWCRSALVVQVVRVENCTFQSVDCSVLSVVQVFTCACVCACACFEKVLSFSIKGHYAVILPAWRLTGERVHLSTWPKMPLVRTLRGLQQNGVPARAMASFTLGGHFLVLLVATAEVVDSHPSASLSARSTSVSAPLFASKSSS